MADVTKNYSKIEVRALFGFLQTEGVSQSEIHLWSVSVYGQKVSAKRH
jgi:hypothetical protein